MVLAPAAGFYARTPQDMRLLRLLLPQRKSMATLAYYIGVANGDDFYSWLPVAIGTKAQLYWIGIDIREECVANVAVNIAHFGIPHELHIHDYREGIPFDLDVVIANRIWETYPEKNQAGLRKILEAEPHLLITRGHGLDGKQLAEVMPKGYKLYSHANQCDDYRPEILGYFYVKDGTWRVDKECPHTRIAGVA